MDRGKAVYGKKQREGKKAINEKKQKQSVINKEQIAIFIRHKI